MSEEWREIDGFPEYAVSDHGRVMNVTTKRILKLTDNGNGYLYVGLYRNRKQFPRYVHRLVLAAFSETQNLQGLEGNHKFGDKSDNRIVSLELTTRSENIQHSYRLGLHPSSKVRIIETQQVFSSISEAARHIGTSQGNVSKVLNGIGKSLKGYTFEYVNDEKEVFL